MKSIFFIISIILLSSCNKKSATKDIINPIENKQIDFFEPADLGAFGSKTRLILYANFDECGEWGGHEESFEIFSKKDREFYAKYKKTKVNCNEIGKLYGKPEFQKPYLNKEIKLENNHKFAINEYLTSLIKSKIKEKFPGHAGQNFGAIKTDSTLVIKIFDSDKKNLENYNKLLKEFSLEIVKYDYR